MGGGEMSAQSKQGSYVDAILRILRSKTIFEKRLFFSDFGDEGTVSRQGPVRGRSLAQASGERKNSMFLFVFSRVQIGDGQGTVRGWSGDGQCRSAERSRSISPFLVFSNI